MKGRRRCWRLRISRAAQVGAILAAGGAAALLGELAANYIAADRMMSQKQAEIARAEMSNAELQELALLLRDRLEAAQGRIDALAGQNIALRTELSAAELGAAALGDAVNTVADQHEAARERLDHAADALGTRAAEIGQLGTRLEALRAELRQSETQRTGLAARLRAVETEMKAADQAKAVLAATERKAPRGQPATAEALLVPVADNAASGWREIERLLGTAGVDLEKFLARFGTVPTGQGGPFVPYDPRKRRAEEPDPAALRTILGSLPLAAPLASYQLESRFGVRADPFNHSKSMHTGLDFSAPFRSPVFNTAPGTVIHAGYKGDYGRIVEIDHGSGIVTRYAHLHRVSVAVGQRVTARQQIGLLGSTGRSSGPHVHYEILVNGVPHDPEKFLNAGRAVAVAAK